MTSNKHQFIMLYYILFFSKYWKNDWYWKKFLLVYHIKHFHKALGNSRDMQGKKKNFNKIMDHIWIKHDILNVTLGELDYMLRDKNVL